MGAVIIPICQMHKWRLKEVIISSRGRIRMRSVYRKFQRPVRAVFMVGRQGTLRASGEALRSLAFWAERICALSLLCLLPF